MFFLMEEAMIKLGPQLYTVREFMQTMKDLEKTFAICQSEGYETVQLSGWKPIPIEDMERLLDKYGIDVCCTHIPFDRLLNDLPAVIEEHRRMHCPVIGLGAAPRQYIQDNAGLTQFIALLTGIANKIKEAGLQFAYHNHSMEFQKLDGRLIFDRLLDETDPELVHFIPDTYWLQLGGVTPADFIRTRLNKRVEVCHFKDLAVEGFQPVFAEVGEGNLDLHACFKACQDIGAKAIVIEQDVCPRDPFDCLKNSYKNLIKIAEDVGDR